MRCVVFMRCVTNLQPENHVILGEFRIFQEKWVSSTVPMALSQNIAYTCVYGALHSQKRSVIQQNTNCLSLEGQNLICPQSKSITLLFSHSKSHGFYGVSSSMSSFFHPWHLPSAHQQVGASYCNVQRHKIHRAEGLHRAILGETHGTRIFLGGSRMRGDFILGEPNHWYLLIIFGGEFR